MSYFAWDRALETGHPILDAEHQSLFALANKLDAAIEDSPDDEGTVSDAVYGLIGYVVEHFSDEETIMLEYRYPMAGPHRSLHEQISSQTLSITTRYFNGEDVTPAELAPLVCTWLRDHIQVHDMALVEYIESIEASRKSAIPA